eukprot:1918408-Rhodomonas_salina.1
MCPLTVRPVRSLAGLQISLSKNENLLPVLKYVPVHRRAGTAAKLAGLRLQTRDLGVKTRTSGLPGHGQNLNLVVNRDQNLLLLLLTLTGCRSAAWPVAGAIPIQSSSHCQLDDVLLSGTKHLKQNDTLKGIARL